MVMHSHLNRDGKTNYSLKLIQPPKTEKENNIQYVTVILCPYFVPQKWFLPILLLFLSSSVWWENGNKNIHIHRIIPYKHKLFIWNFHHQLKNKNIFTGVCTIHAVRTWSFLRQQRLTDLSKTNILLNFICPFVPKGENMNSAKNRYNNYWIRLDQNRTTDTSRQETLTNNGKRHPPTQARSLFRSKGEYMGETLAGNLCAEQRKEIQKRWSRLNILFQAILSFIL